MRPPIVKHTRAWFDLRRRSAGFWAFALNRVTALGLTVYLYLHLIVLGRLAQGPEAFDSFIEMAKSPLFVFGEWLVVAAGFYHGLNGLRVALNAFGIGVRYQKHLFYALGLLAAAASLVFAVRMFSV